MILTNEQKQEIAEARENPQPTLRPTIKELEEILYIPVPVLDKGSLTLVDYQGDESFIAASARVSYGKGTKKVSGNRSLLRYMMRHRHLSPFEQASMAFRIEMPIMVMRQLVRQSLYR
jgi:thymidylate synthase (FAD)